MRDLLFLAILLGSPALYADTASAPPDAYIVTADQWAQQRSGSALLKLQALHDAVQTWLAEPQAHITIRHAASDAGHLWAGELSDWLVSLGIPADHIDRQASADQPEDSVSLLVRRG
jgi:hypothetical protein